MTSRRGTSFIDLIISMAIIAVLFGGIYLIYFSLITAIGNISVRQAAASVVNAEIETIRNLPYDSVGTVGGVPAGIIPQTQTSSVGQYVFTLTTTIRNIDDPFDGTVNGTPPDTAPADYKLVEIDATCSVCTSAVAVSDTTTVAPKNLESATQNGSLFLFALDANGNPIADASAHVVNASVTPSINLTDTTNASGVLQLVGVPTSTQGYQITMTKPGYSSEQTYPIGGAGNPNPVKPNATIVAQTVTNATFSIDRLSALTVYASDNRCVAAAEPFTIQGGKLIGTTPNVLKYSATSTTNASGSVTLQSLEWDSYALTLNDAAKNVVGTIPLTPMNINPSSTPTFRFVVAPAVNPSLLVTAIDSASGAGIANAVVSITKSGVSQTLTTGHAVVSQTDWSGGQYSSKSSGISVNAVPGALTLLVNASGTYATSTNDWLISNTFDLGGSSSTLYSIAWNPVSQSGAGTVQFQVAANNDNATWNFVGPDGTSGTFFTASSSLPIGLSGNRYLRYEAFLNTTDPHFTPELDDVTLEFSADCVPPAQVFFSNLPQGTYTVNISAPNYTNASTSIAVGAGTQSVTVDLIHL